MTHALTVLVIDDCAPMRAILATILISGGHEVVVAESVDAALDLLDVQRPDMILTDYNMPGSNGVDLVRRVRSREELRDIPIFVVSTEQNTESRSRMDAAGANGWISKPVSVGVVLTAVEAVASTRGEARPRIDEAGPEARQRRA